jgi:hypothetical protein
MRVFEETFGIDKLLNLVSKLGEKIDNVDLYDPVNNKYLLNENELQMMMDALDEFKTRH